MAYEGDEMGIVVIRDLKKKEEVLKFDVRKWFRNSKISAIEHNWRIVAMAQTPDKEKMFPVIRIFSKRNKECMYEKISHSQTPNLSLRFSIATTHYITDSSPVYLFILLFLSYFFFSVATLFSGD